jgi:N-acetylmuramoyl-L-alanine amidase
MRICLDVAHMGKVSRPRDRGAVYKTTKESNIVLLYAISAMGYLEKADHIVFLACHDDYSARQEFCRKAKVDLHLQCHLNAGKGSYSLILYKENGAELLAQMLAVNLQDKLRQQITNAKVEKATKHVRGFNCIMKDIPSLLLEPMFLDNDEHYEFLVYKAGTMELGKIIADTIIQWDAGGRK